MLERECSAAGVEIKSGVQVREVQRGSEFIVRSDGDEFHAASVVVATGGLSIPKIGATPFGYAVAKQFGVAIRECRPALVPLVLNAEDRRNYLRSGRRLGRGGCVAGAHAVSREAADHASRPERAGGAANLVVLEWPRGYCL